jgi:non-ribosomal peptide synthase protein (TIGR01720 family)
VLRRVLAVERLPRLIVSTVDLAARLERWLRPARPERRRASGSDAAAEPAMRSDAGADAGLGAGDTGHSVQGGATRHRHPRPRLPQPWVAPRDERQRQLVEIWQDLLGIDRIGIDDGFLELGGDSVISLQMISRARQVGIELTPRQVFEHRTVAELAAAADAADAAGADLAAGRAEQGRVGGPVPLTPIQRWFVAQQLARPHHWNQAMLLAPAEPVAARHVAAAVARLVAHHDALRLRFRRGPDGWSQHNAATAEGPSFACVDLRALPPPAAARAIEDTAPACHASLDLEHGPLLRAVWFERGGGLESRLLLTAHHLVVDAISWRILLEDLDTACRQLRSSLPVRLPAKTSSYRQWGLAAAELARAPEVAAALATWLDPARRGIPPLPGDEASAALVRVQLAADETRQMLQESLRALALKPDEVLLAALALSAGAASGEPRLLVDLEGHGREAAGTDLDLSRTVGWFTTIYPVLLDLRGLPPGSAAALNAAKEQVRAAHAGAAAYNYLRWYAESGGGGSLAAAPAAEVSFLYLGQLDRALARGGLLVPAAEITHGTRDPRGRRSHLLDVKCSIVDERLQATFVYSRNRLSAAAAQRLADDFIAALRLLLRAAAAPPDIRYSPADFDQVQLSQADLDEVLAQVQADRE